MLSTTAEYALRMVIALAEAPEESLTSGVLSQRTKVPGGYTVKVLQHLARAGIVRAQRGRGGGYALDRDPRRTSLLDVVNAIEPVQRITRCPLDRQAHQSRLCPLHQRLDDVLAMLEQSLGELTIAAVVEGGRRPGLCPPRERVVALTRERARATPAPAARGRRRRTS
jgi:Rrf2 family protein